MILNTQPSGGKDLPPCTRLEEFVIERVLGSGGFGITYLARDASLNRQVVIKENHQGKPPQPVRPPGYQQPGC